MLIDHLALSQLSIKMMWDPVEIFHEEEFFNKCKSSLSMNLSLLRELYVEILCLEIYEIYILIYHKIILIWQRVEKWDTLISIYNFIKIYDVRTYDVNIYDI